MEFHSIRWIYPFFKWSDDDEMFIESFFFFHIWWVFNLTPCMQWAKFNVIHFCHNSNVTNVEVFFYIFFFMTQKKYIEFLFIHGNAKTWTGKNLEEEYPDNAWTFTCDILVNLSGLMRPLLINLDDLHVNNKVFFLTINAVEFIMNIN